MLLVTAAIAAGSCLSLSANGAGGWLESIPLESGPIHLVRSTSRLAVCFQCGISSSLQVSESTTRYHKGVALGDFRVRPDLDNDPVEDLGEARDHSVGSRFRRKAFGFLENIKRLPQILLILIETAHAESAPIVPR